MWNYQALAGFFLLLHLAWIAWVVLGWLWTRRRPLLRWLHIGSVVYGLLIEIFFWTCPLTYLEQWAQRRAGREPYRGDFLVHYLDAVVYPDVPPEALTAAAVVVCGFILAVYVVRFRRRDERGW